jgi:aspartate carbamoyltransferase catalytic subunit
VTVQLAMPESKPVQWTRRHLLGLEDLSRADIEIILDTAEGFVEVSQRRRKKRSDLKGKVIVNLFFEPSTRTRASFAFRRQASQCRHA